MDRRTAWLFVALVVAAAPASAATTGFSLTHEESLNFPQPNRWIALPGYDAAVGQVQVFADQTAMLIAPDPINAGSLPCDATSAQALILDASTRVAEAHLKFPMTAAGNMIIFDKLELGAERTDVRGLRVGVFSGVDRTPEIDFEFGSDGHVYVFGQRVPTPTGDLAYGNVFQSDCGIGKDEHITLVMWHNLTAGTVMVDLTTHGATGSFYRLGPFPMAPAIRAQGIGGMYLYAPPLSGRYYVDGMVCTGTEPIVAPRGGTTTDDERRRY